MENYFSNKPVVKKDRFAEMFGPKNGEREYYLIETYNQNGEWQCRRLSDTWLPVSLETKVNPNNLILVNTYMYNIYSNIVPVGQAYGYKHDNIQVNQDNKNILMSS